MYMKDLVASPIVLMPRTPDFRFIHPEYVHEKVLTMYFRKE